MKEFNFSNGPLARKIGLYVIIVSACITLFTSGIQLYSEYKRDVNSIHIRLDQLKRTQVDNIASRLWVLDIPELQRTLKTLLNLPSIEYVAVYDYDKLLLSVGTDFQKNVIAEKHRLLFQHDNQIQDIGFIVIKASLDEVYKLIIDRAVVIVLSNGLKTFLVAGFILFIFYHLVARHLGNISKTVQSTNFLQSSDNLKLHRDRQKNTDDELDIVVNSINTMRSRLASQLAEIGQQKQYLSLTLNSIGDAVITTDIAGKITRMNAVAESLTGWSYKEAMGRSVNSVFQVVDSETFEPIEDLVARVLNRDESRSVKNNTVLFSRDGSEYHISYTATPINDEQNNFLGVVLIFHDITEQFRLREDIAKNKRDMQAIMDHSPAVIYIKDIHGKYLFINKRYETLFNVTRNTFLGKKDSDIFDKESSDTFKRNDDNVKRAGHALEIEESVILSDGELHTYMSVKFPLLDENGNIYAICGISNDITERKVQDAHFRRAQKMDALGKLTSGIAHDYNNMLGIILGYAQLLEASLIDKPDLKKYASEIRHAGDRGTKLTKKLLNFSSNQDSSDATNVNINNLLRAEQHMLEKTLTAKIRLVMELTDDLWFTHLDSGELEDAIVNMSINAMHAIEDVGELVIKTANKLVLKREADRLGIRPGEYVVLSVSDTGCGMDELTKEKIFDPFYSTKGAKGTGLGLSQVYGFVERCLGAIDVSSTPGKGARFDLYFPKALGSSRAVQIGNKVSGDSLSGTETVLVVDDEASLVSLLNESLVQHGYNVLTAYDGEQALEILMNEPVDLVITDIIMPKLDGSQLVMEIREKYPHIKMQMVSGYADLNISRNLDNNLAKKILYKPFPIEVLISRVRTLLEEPRQLN